MSISAVAHQQAPSGASVPLVVVDQNIMLLLVSRPTILLLNILFQVLALFWGMEIERHHVQFFTAVCNDWLLLLESDEAKEIVVNALHYQVKVGHVKIAAFVIMPNHLHLIWRIQNECRLEDVQRKIFCYCWSPDQQSCCC